MDWILLDQALAMGRAAEKQYQDFRASGRSAGRWRQVEAKKSRRTSQERGPVVIRGRTRGDQSSSTILHRCVITPSYLHPLYHLAVGRGVELRDGGGRTFVATGVEILLVSGTHSIRWVAFPTCSFQQYSQRAAKLKRGAPVGQMGHFHAQDQVRTRPDGRFQREKSHLSS